MEQDNKYLIKFRRSKEEEFYKSNNLQNKNFNTLDVQRLDTFHNTLDKLITDEMLRIEDTKRSIPGLKMLIKQQENKIVEIFSSLMNDPYDIIRINDVSANIAKVHDKGMRSVINSRINALDKNIKKLIEFEKLLKEYNK